MYVVKGNPTPWKRAGRYGDRYYDQQLFEKERFRIEIGTQDPDELYSGPLIVNLNFYVLIAQSMGITKRKLIDGKLHAVKPDLDNLCKFVLDACKSILYTDDAQICQISMNKVYSLDPRTEIVITQLENK
jgi:Holliday junction resolvase RusA-like endonuclease